MERVKVTLFVTKEQGMDEACTSVGPTDRGLADRAPTVSIVIPLGPDLEWFEEQIDALAMQQYSGGVELILSCNGIAPELVLDRYRVPLESGWWTLLLVDSSAVRGPSHARNAGWRAASSELVLFCDADDVVAPGWIAAFAGALATAPVCGGAHEFVRLNPSGTGAWGRVSVASLPEKFSHLPFIPSGNLGVRRSVLDELGGFDESLLRSEDVDFSWRAQYAGRAIRFVPDAVVSVRRRGTFAALVRQAGEDAAADRALLALHHPRGARWSVRDTVREAAGVAVAMAQAPFGRGHRAKLATRAGRFLGHVRAFPAARRPVAATTAVARGGRRSVDA